MLKTMKDSDDFVDEVFSQIADKTILPNYGMNFDCSVKRLLSEVPYHISERENLDIAECKGINKSSFYLSQRFSFSDMHVEDGYLDSCNLMRWSDDNAFKYWLIPSPHFNTKLTDAIYNDIRILRSTENCDSWLPNCSTPLNHKNIVITPRYLEDHGIPYMTVIQPPGSLVYVRGYVFHQVISTGITFSEAVNVGNSVWNTSSHMFISCNCPGRELSSIVGNISSYSIVRSRRDTVICCPKDGCTDFMRGKKAMDVHLKRHSNNSLTDNCCCSLCGIAYLNVTNLELHQHNVHGKLYSNNMICPGCGVIIRIKSFAGHIKVCGPKFIDCIRCKQKFKRRGFSAHERRCTAPMGLFDNEDCK